jgi:hypothetical protein
MKGQKNMRAQILEKEIIEFVDNLTGEMSNKLTPKEKRTVAGRVYLHYNQQLKLIR